MSYINELKTLYSDLYKDVNGFRPKPLPDMPEGWYREAIHRMEGELVEEMQMERDRQQVASQLFWNHIKQLMADYRISMPAAIRWDMMAEGMDDDLEHYLWLKDLTWEEIDRCKKSFGHLIKEFA